MTGLGVIGECVQTWSRYKLMDTWVYYIYKIAQSHLQNRLLLLLVTVDADVHLVTCSTALVGLIYEPRKQHGACQPANSWLAPTASSSTADPPYRLLQAQHGLRSANMASTTW